jgi:hypothetical protein
MVTREFDGLTAEMYRAVTAIVDDRMREIKVTREDFDALRAVVEELARSQRDLAAAQARTEDALRDLARHVGKLGETIGFGSEDIAHVVLPGYLERHHGIKLEGPLGDELDRKFFITDGWPVEVNLYGEGLRDGQKVVILGEAKARIGGSEVHKFAQEIKKVEPLVEGEIWRVMFGYRIHPTAREAAQEHHILLVASYQR